MEEFKTKVRNKIIVWFIFFIPLITIVEVLLINIFVLNSSILLVIALIIYTSHAFIIIRLLKKVL